MSRVAPALADPVAAAKGNVAVNFDDVKPQSQSRPQPQPQPRTRPAAVRGTAADLGKFITKFDLKWAGGNGPNSSVSTVSVQQTTKVLVAPNTTVTETFRVLGYGGRNGVQGTAYNATVGVNRTLPSAPKTKTTVDATVGVELRQQQRPTFNDNLAVDVALTYRGEWQVSDRVALFSDVSAKQVFAATSQARFRSTVGATYTTPDKNIAVTAYAAGECRIDEVGPRASRATTPFMRTVGADLSFGIGQGNKVVVGVANTWGGAGSSITPSSNEGLSAQIGVQIGL